PLSSPGLHSLSLRDALPICLHRILLATNFRPSSIAATQRARELAAITKAELHAIYVIGDYFEQISVMFPEGGRTALSRLRAEVTDRKSTRLNSSHQIISYAV